MKIGWGWKIVMLYLGFVVMIIGLVVASSRQKIDLVSKDYYKEEIAYQGVLDASRNQANLVGVISVHASSQEVVIDFPDELNAKLLTGNVKLYAAANQSWDRDFDINTNSNKMVISRKDLQPTIYTIKVSYEAEGRSFYHEAKLNLRAL